MLRDVAQVRSTLNYFGSLVPRPSFTGGRIASCSFGVGVEGNPSFNFQDLECILEENVLDCMSRSGRFTYAILLC